MFVKDIIPCDTVSYKKAAMYVAFPYCTFKCEKDCGIKCCQNSDIAKQPNIEMPVAEIIKLYNPLLVHSIVLCGLEPFESFADMLDLIIDFRSQYEDDIVIYTGYKEDEIKELVEQLKRFPNIIIKYGRFVPNKEPHIDEILGVKLMNPEQYAKKIS